MEEAATLARVIGLVVGPSPFEFASDEKAARSDLAALRQKVLDHLVDADGDLLTVLEVGEPVPEAQRAAADKLEATFAGNDALATTL